MCPVWGFFLLSLCCGSTVSFSHISASDFEDSMCRRRIPRKEEDSRFNPIPSRHERYPIADFRPKTINIPVLCLHENLHEANQSWDINHVMEFYRNDTFGKMVFITLHGKGKGAASAWANVLFQTSNGTEIPDLLCYGVSVESNLTFAMLVVSSSCLLRESNGWPTSGGTFTIKRSPMDNKTTEEMNIRVSKKKVLIAKNIWVTNTTAEAQAFIVCDMKLCHNLSFNTCPAGCSPLFWLNSPVTVNLETYHIAQNSLTDLAYYTILVLGIVLGCAALAGVAVLVKKFIARKHFQNIASS